MTSRPGGSVSDLAGAWEGRFPLRLANAAATMEIKPDGAYAGTLHTEAGERPFSGAIVVLPTGRVRYQGSNGNGIVMVSRSATTGTTLRFVPDGGGGGGSFTRGK
jgi:hypothetical protein